MTLSMTMRSMEVKSMSRIRVMMKRNANSTMQKMIEYKSTRPNMFNNGADPKKIQVPRPRVNKIARIAIDDRNAWNLKVAFFESSEPS